MLGRADNRGLGIQTWEFHEHMQPTATLIVLMGPGKFTPYTERIERYSHGEVRAGALDARGELPDECLRWLIDSCDVIYSAETPYDYRLIEWARAAGVRVVIQGNYEFCKWLSEPDLPRPDLFLAPSLWHFEDWPEPKMYLPFPVARERLPYRHRTEARRFLHTHGHTAMQDRNGTRSLMQALSYIGQPAEFVIRSQSRLGTLNHSRARPRGVTIRTEQGDVENYWDMYADDCDVLVLPRRFGGQSLPMNEALACGMPVLMLDCPPQNEMLPAECLIPTRARRPLQCQAGTIDCFDVDPRDIARRINDLMGSPELVARLSHMADGHAEAISWRTLGPRYREVLEGLL